MIARGSGVMLPMRKSATVLIPEGRKITITEARGLIRMRAGALEAIRVVDRTN